MENPSFQALLEYDDAMKKTSDIYRVAIKKFDLSEGAFWILYSLRVEKRSYTQAEICDILHEPKQTVNSALKKLETAGYVFLEAGEDQRSKKVRLTPAGEALAEKTVDRIADAEAEALNRMSDQERAELVRLTRLYGELFEQQVKKL